MRLVVAVIVLVGLLVGVPLARSSGGGGAAMVLFAILAVIFFASLPVLTGKYAARSRGTSRNSEGRRVVDFEADRQGRIDR